MADTARPTDQQIDDWLKHQREVSLFTRWIVDGITERLSQRSHEQVVKALEALCAEKADKATAFEALVHKLDDDGNYTSADRCNSRALVHREWLTDIGAIMAALASGDPAPEPTDTGK